MKSWRMVGQLMAVALALLLVFWAGLPARCIVAVLMVATVIALAALAAGVAADKE